MTYQGTDIRTAFAAIFCTLAMSTIFMLGSLGPAIA